MKKIMFFLIPVLASVLFCQVFTDTGAVLTGVSNSSVSWGDYDNDMDMDVLVTGFTGSVKIAKIYNNDHGTFTEIAAELTGVDFSSAAWGDYDGDGDLDLLLTGYADNPPFYSSKIYRNDSGSFTDINAGLTGVQSGSVAWGDYD